MANKDKYHLYSIVGMAQFEGLKQLGFYDTPYIDAAIALHKDGYYLSPDVDSGLMSVKAYNNAISGNSRENTHDHYRSRTKSSKEFFQHYDNGRFHVDRLSRVEAWFKSRCRVHTITRQENTDLIPIQNDLNLKDAHYSAHYEKVGINTLVPKPDLRNKFIFVIENQAYDTAQNVADEYKISTATVHSRCNSKSENFKQWKKIPKKNQLLSLENV